MNKLAQQELYTQYFLLGSQEAVKTAGISMEAIRKALGLGGDKMKAFRQALAKGGDDVVPFSRALGERQGGIIGSVGGLDVGVNKGLELAGHVAPENPLLIALLGGGGGMLGMGAGNLIGRKGGDLAGRLGGMLQQTKPVRSLGNMLADPLAQVRGINKVR